jgi:hypothetical protein
MITIRTKNISDLRVNIIKLKVIWYDYKRN